MAGRIVVGVDGSDGSTAALRWALDEARLRDAKLRVVHAWKYVSDKAGIAAAYPVGYEEIERKAREVLTRSIEQAGPAAEPRVEAILAGGGAVTVLLETAKGADLLVVGSRGRGGFAGLLLGSVSQQCAQHAPCPVVIVPQG